ncbi:LysR family transcriptional regulator [Mesorhizobium sp. M0306]|uniref:LysR family transcriptional regulator n=1 Tax=unclassified Mesorhizobium TaxID=325217 RepID=UPI003334CCDB
MVGDLIDMVAFASIAETGSLSAAARKLSLSLAVVSRRLSRLESRLGMRLVNRTTRRLSLTDEGTAFYARCARILSDIEEAELEVTRGRETASGLLRVTSTVAFGRRTLAPLLVEFQRMHEGLQIHLHSSDTIENIVDAGYDLAVRFGALPDSSLVARQLAPNIRIICAAPSYLERCGRPAAVEDLLRHDCIAFGNPILDHWTFANGETIKVKGVLTSNDGETAHAWALQGAGLILKSIWDVADDLRTGRLVTVLSQFPLPASPIHAVYPHSRHAAAKVRLCVDFLAQKLRRIGLPHAGI